MGKFWEIERKVWGCLSVVRSIFLWLGKLWRFAAGVEKAVNFLEKG